MSKTILCVIGARGGSKGVPGKNTKIMIDKPLIAWTIERALQSSLISKVIVSTDDENIAKVAREYGAEVPFMRPTELATCEAGKFSVWKHALATCEKIDNIQYDWFLDMDCTNPLLEPSDITGILEAFETENKKESLDGMFTVSAPHRNPYFNQVEEHPDGTLYISKSTGNGDILARQAAPPVWDIVGGLYLFHARYIREANLMMDGRLKPYKLPREKALDIDEPLDWDMVEYFLKRRLQSGKA